MMSHGVKLLVVILVFTMMAGSATAWESELYPSNWVPPHERTNPPRFDDGSANGRMIQDYSYAGYRRGEQAIPSNQTNIINVTLPPYSANPNDTNSDTAAIQAAINDAGAAGGGVVYLPAGTYYLPPQNNKNYALLIDKSNVVIRGAGMNQTFLYNPEEVMRNKKLIWFRGSASGSWRDAVGNAATITSDLMSPTKKIPVSSVSPFNVGDYVVLRTDCTEEFIAEHNETENWGGHGETIGGLRQYRQITAIDSQNKVLTIDAPTRYYFKIRDNARVYKTVTHVEEVGIENLTIGNKQNSNPNGWGRQDYKEEGTGAYEVHNSYLVEFCLARHAWMRNVNSFRHTDNPDNYHLLSNATRVVDSAYVTVANCEFQRPQYRGDGGNGYMYCIMGSENLFSECIGRYARHAWTITAMETSGIVMHKCLSDSSEISSDHHKFLSQSTLHDQVTVDKDRLMIFKRNEAGTIRHGESGTSTVFWNTRGENYYPNNDDNHIIISRAWKWGYIIGTQGPASNIHLRSGGAPQDFVEGVGAGTSLTPQSLYLDQLARRLGQGGSPPAAPSSLAATAQSDSRIDLAWSDNSSNESGFKIERKAAGGSFSQVDTVVANTTAYADTGLDSGTTYTYRVRAYNANGNSAYSNEASATTPSRVLLDPGVGLKYYVDDSGNDGNLPENVADNDYGTRWSSNGVGQWISFEFEDQETIEAVDIAWHNGDSRTAYFDLQVSDDNFNWTTVLADGESAGDTLALETFTLSPPVSARHLMIWGKGNSNNNWNSITEVRVHAGDGGGSPGDKLAVAGVTASADDGNVPANTLDDDLGTRWSANGQGQWIRYDLGETKTVTGVGLAWHSGNTRTAYFDVEVSDDGDIWTTALSAAQSSGTTLDIEQHNLTTPAQARYVRIVGQGNSSNNWNSITETHIYGDAGTGGGGQDQLAGDVGDAERQGGTGSAGGLTSGGSDTLLAGRYTGAGAAKRNPIFVFDLSGVTGAVQDAELKLYFQGKLNSPGYEADLYAVGYASSPTPSHVGYYADTNPDTASGVTLLADDFVTSATTDGQYLSVSGSTLVNYLNNRPGGQDYVFFRLSPDGTPSQETGYLFSSADHANSAQKPVLIVE